ncbi:MAG: hypothetical protein JWR01_592 [Subtercola sp.]|nr:hypothetical protein [Subtercola sp.]
MLREGYDGVNVDDIAAAAGISRTTFFRYFGSKPGVIWAAFDATIAGLEAAIGSQAPSAGTMDALRYAIVASTRSAVHSSDVWLERFQLLDGTSDLRAEAHEHWEQWKLVIARFVSARCGQAAGGAVPMAIAGACQGVFLSALRDERNTDDGREAMLVSLDRNLAEVGGALGALLPG